MNQLECANRQPGTILDTEYLFYVDRGSTIRPHDNGTVAVIDGSELLSARFTNTLLIKNRITEIDPTETRDDTSPNVINRDHDKRKYNRLLFQLEW